LHTSDENRFAIVGPGRLGVAIIDALSRNRFDVTAVSPRPGSALDPAATPPRLALEDAIARADVVWLTVPDDAITGAADAVAAAAGTRIADLTVIHSSGLGSLTLLSGCADRGARTLVLHPLQTFATLAPSPLAGVPVAVTAAAADEAFGLELVAALGARPFMLPDANKPVYHLAATMACNLFVALEAQAADLMRDATGADGLELLGPLLETTLANVRAQGCAGALTGPVARGDAGTVATHLALLADRDPASDRAYRALSQTALALALPNLTDEQAAHLRKLFEEGDLLVTEATRDKTAEARA